MRTLARTISGILGADEPDFGALPYRPNEIWRMVGDSSRARAVLGWSPAVPLDEGLARTVEWYRDRLRDRTHPGGIG